MAAQEVYIVMDARNGTLFGVYEAYVDAERAAEYANDKYIGDFDVKRWEVIPRGAEVVEVAERWVSTALTAVKDIELAEGIHGEVMCRNAMLAAIGRRVSGIPNALACSAVDTAIENLFNA